MKSKTVPLYTKTGDVGRSSVIDGRRISKDGLVFEVVGTIDELNSWLGYAAVIAAPKIKIELQEIQRCLLILGAIVAGSVSVALTQADISFLEKRIDWYQAHTGKNWYTRFLLPGGTESGGRFDLARSVCRRLERRLVRWQRGALLPQSIRNLVLAYINRLSDYLFSLHCFVNAQAGYEEIEFGR